MRALAKASYVLGVLAAVALTASAADARSANNARFGGAYDSVSAPRASAPYDAGGPAYSVGQRGLDDSSDFQLQGR
jgi:hypothetical protein